MTQIHAPIHAYAHRAPETPPVELQLEMAKAQGDDLREQLTRARDELREAWAEIEILRVRAGEWVNVSADPSTWPPVDEEVIIWRAPLGLIDVARRTVDDKWQNWNWHRDIEMTEAANWMRLTPPTL